MVSPRYLEEIVEEVWSCDGLAVVARGLGAQRVVAELIGKCCDSREGGVVLCLNVSRKREAGLRSALLARGVDESRLPVFASAETHSRERRKRAYEEPATRVVCASCRVAIVDLLDETLDAARVRGVIVADAHRAGEGSAEGFVVRAYREKNWGGWVRAVSDDAEATCRGFARATKVMKELEVERLSVWPRFEVRVARCLDRRPANVVELRRPLSASSRRAQNAIVVALETCLGELRKATAGVVEAAEVEQQTPLAACDAVIRTVLFARGTSARARVLAAELKSLRDLVEAVPRYDAVSFFDLVLSVRDAALKRDASQRRPVSAWARGLALDELVVAARARVYVGRNGGIEKVLEENVKWRLVRDAVAEGCSSGGDDKRVVIVARDDHAAAGLADFLARGGVVAMETRFLAFLGRHNARARTLPEDRRTPEQRLLVAEEAALKRVYENNDVPPPPPPPPPPNISSRRVVIATREQYRARNDALAEWLPDVVVVVDAEPEIVREVEAYQARCGDRTITTYVLVCDESADDATYEAALRAETEAFEKLVGERGLALVPSSASRAAERQAKDRQPAPKKKKATIVVDSREFRSQLPSFLHARGVRLAPATLVVGDYVLTPELVVERKSLTDLAGSLQSGRLYGQVEAMQRHYATPVLLVEAVASFFGATPASQHESSSSSTSSYDKQAATRKPTDDIDDLPSTASIEARFSLLAMTYPRLRVVWCRDGNATVNVFAGLKRGRDQPRLETAIDKKAAVCSDRDDGGRNVAAIDLLLKLPGVNDRNVAAIIENVDNLRELTTLDQPSLVPLVGPSNAKLLYDFFHEIDTTVLPMPPPEEHSSTDAEASAAAAAADTVFNKPSRRRRGCRSTVDPASCSPYFVPQAPPTPKKKPAAKKRKPRSKSNINNQEASTAAADDDDDDCSPPPPPAAKRTRPAPLPQ